MSRILQQQKSSWLLEEHWLCRSAAGSEASPYYGRNEEVPPFPPPQIHKCTNRKVATTKPPLLEDKHATTTQTNTHLPLHETRTPPCRDDSQTLNVFSLQPPLRIPTAPPPIALNSLCLAPSLFLSVHRITGSRRRSSQISLQESRGFFFQSRCSQSIKTASPSLLFFLLLLVLHISSGRLEIQKHKQNGKQKT